MAEAIQAGIGAFLGSLGSQLEQGRVDKKRKHEQWMACIMQGNSAEACSQILGYDPGEEGRRGAEGLQAERRTEAEREEAKKRYAEREKFGRETAVKRTTVPLETATKLDIPLDEERMRQATITPGGATVSVGDPELAVSRELRQREGPDWEKELGQFEEKEKIKAKYEKPPGPGVDEYYRNLATKPPEDLTPEQIRQLISRGYEWDETAGGGIGAWMPKGGQAVSPWAALGITPKGMGKKSGESLEEKMNRLEETQKEIREKQKKR